MVVDDLNVVFPALRLAQYVFIFKECAAFWAALIGLRPRLPVALVGVDVEPRSPANFLSSDSIWSFRLAAWRS